MMFLRMKVHLGSFLRLEFPEDIMRIFDQLLPFNRVLVECTKVRGKVVKAD
jgi:hypothetical protein